mmetsp:Transcript_15906/g.43043  ORF Transcript_15906/g.43043 Transcript_15906/m.43043 type:complete len:128 (-) Transcript_15906:1041-1424(-)
MSSQSGAWRPRDPSDSGSEALSSSPTGGISPSPIYAFSFSWSLLFLWTEPPPPLETTPRSQRAAMAVAAAVAAGSTKPKGLAISYLSATTITPFDCSYNATSGLWANKICEVLDAAGLQVRRADQPG